MVNLFRHPETEFAQTVPQMPTRKSAAQPVVWLEKMTPGSQSEVLERNDDDVWLLWDDSVAHRLDDAPK
jgi:hypothetical protein